MEKFCEYCGRKLQEGEICMCQKNSETVTSTDTPTKETEIPDMQSEYAVQGNTAEQTPPQDQALQSLNGQPYVQPYGQYPQGQPFGQHQQEQHQPNQQGQPYVQPYGQYPQGQSYPQGQPNGQPYPQGQSNPQNPYGQPYPQGQPFGQYPQGQPYPQGQSNPQNPYGQPYPQGQSNPQNPYGQPYPQGQPFVHNPAKPNETLEKGKKFLKKVVGNFLNLIKNPVTTGQSIAQEADVKMAGFMIGLQAIFSSLFALIVCNKIWSTILSASKTVVTQILSALGLDSFGYYMGSITDDLQTLLGNAPYGRMFFYTFIFSALLSVLLAAAFLVGYKMIKIETSYAKMLTIVSLRSMLLLPTTLAAIILAVISPVIGITVFAVAGVWGFVCMLLVMQAAIEEEKKNQFASMYTIVVVVFLFLSVFFERIGIKGILTDIMALFS